MFKKVETYRFLESKGLELIKQDTSEYFGDYFDLFRSKDFELRFSRSKSFLSVDIRSIDDSNWYDLALVKALLYKEHSLNKPTTIEEHVYFLQKDLALIGKLFEKHIYPNTKKELEDLGNKRARQMFPEEEIKK